MMANTKYIFITGGVVSSLGKGIAAASIGALLESRGLSVSLIKVDPYINVDPGTMSPFQHGEVFVTNDGTETDLDLGHYERFTNISSKKTDNITTGRIYSDIIRKESGAHRKSDITLHRQKYKKKLPLPNPFRHIKRIVIVDNWPA